MNLFRTKTPAAIFVMVILCLCFPIPIWSHGDGAIITIMVVGLSVIVILGQGILGFLFFYPLQNRLELSKRELLYLIIGWPIASIIFYTSALFVSRDLINPGWAVYVISSLVALSFTLLTVYLKRRQLK